MDSHPETSTPLTSRLDQDLQETVEAQGSQQVEGPLVAHPQEVTLLGEHALKANWDEIPHDCKLCHTVETLEHLILPEGPNVLELVPAQMENGKVAKSR